MVHVRQATRKSLARRFSRNRRLRLLSLHLASLRLDTRDPRRLHPLELGDLATAQVNTTLRIDPDSVSAHMDFAERLSAAIPPGDLVAVERANGDAPPGGYVDNVTVDPQVVRTSEIGPLLPGIPRRRRRFGCGGSRGRRYRLYLACRRRCCEG